MLVRLKYKKTKEVPKFIETELGLINDEPDLELGVKYLVFGIGVSVNAMPYQDGIYYFVRRGKWDGIRAIPAILFEIIDEQIPADWKIEPAAIVEGWLSIGPAFIHENGFVDLASDYNKEAINQLNDYEQFMIDSLGYVDIC